MTKTIMTTDFERKVSTLLDMDRTHCITDVIHGAIPYSGIESAVISTPIFNRLHRVLQSSMAYLTYPSNKVKRFEHSVGTMHLAGKVFFNAVTNTLDDETILEQFFSDLEGKICDWYNECDFTGKTLFDSRIEAQYPPGEKAVLTAPLPSNTLYHQNTPCGLPSNHRFMYTVCLQSVRLAGLLHDVGHLPYSHVLEEAIRMLHLRVKNLKDDKRTKAMDQFLDIIGPYTENGRPKDLHEKLGNELVVQIEEILENEIKNFQNDYCIFFGAVFYLTKQIMITDVSTNNIFSDLHRIISGTVDVDRMDYCSRDLYCSGLRQDIYPYDRVISTYRLRRIKVEADSSSNGRKRFLFCPSAKVLLDIEDLLQRRYTIFERINYHHRVHMHEVLFAEVLSNVALNELMDQQNGIPGVKPNSVLPLSVSGIWALILKLKKRHSILDYLIIQLDDSWMDTLLKSTFIETYKDKYKDFDNNGNDPTWNRYDELISAAKHYIACFKRSSDFWKFDAAFAMHWKNVTSIELFQNDSVERCFLESADTLCDKVLNPSVNPSNEFLFNYMLDSVQIVLNISPEDFFLQLEEKLNSDPDSLDRFHVVNCMIRSCDFNTGYDPLQKPVYLWTEDTELKLKEISVLDDNFQVAIKKKLRCHLYCLPKYDMQSMKVLVPDTNGLIDYVAEVAATVLWNGYLDRTTQPMVG